MKLRFYVVHFAILSIATVPAFGQNFPPRHYWEVAAGVASVPLTVLGIWKDALITAKYHVDNNAFRSGGILLLPMDEPNVKGAAINLGYERRLVGRKLQLSVGLDADISCVESVRNQAYKMGIRSDWDHRRQILPE